MFYVQIEKLILLLYAFILQQDTEGINVFSTLRGTGNFFKPLYDKDWGLQLFPMNEEFPVSSGSWMFYTSCKGSGVLASSWWKDVQSWSFRGSKSRRSIESLQVMAIIWELRIRKKNWIKKQLGKECMVAGALGGDRGCGRWWWCLVLAAAGKGRWVVMPATPVVSALRFREDIILELLE